MRKCKKFSALIVGQILVFYLLPLLSKSLGAMGMVLALVMATFLLSVKTGNSVRGKVKWLYPLFTAALFIPSVFLYYNSSALIQSIWYLAVSSLGVLIGTLTAATHKH